MFFSCYGPHKHAHSLHRGDWYDWAVGTGKKKLYRIHTLPFYTAVGSKAYQLASYTCFPIYIHTHLSFPIQNPAHQPPSHSFPIRNTSPSFPPTSAQPCSAANLFALSLNPVQPCLVLPLPRRCDIPGRILPSFAQYSAAASESVRPVRARRGSKTVLSHLFWEWRVMDWIVGLDRV